MPIVTAAEVRILLCAVSVLAAVLLVMAITALFAVAALLLLVRVG
jgi:hypothetical protein